MVPGTKRNFRQLWFAAECRWYHPLARHDFLIVVDSDVRSIELKAVKVSRTVIPKNKNNNSLTRYPTTCIRHCDVVE